MILPVSLYLEYPPKGEISLKISSANMYLVRNPNCKEMNFWEKQENEKQNKTKKEKGKGKKEENKRRRGGSAN